MNYEASTINAHERVVIAFASLQIFALIYLQKFAIGGNSFPIPVPMLIMLISIAWMVVTRNLCFSAPRLTGYIVFATCCLWSQSLSGGSLPSLVELVLLYAAIILCIHVSASTYQRIIDRFTMFMLFPAFIIIVQYTYQKLTGLSDPINLDRMIPKSALLQGFFYDAHYPWNSPFSRPNGFFFLEPSFASAFTASAAIIELSYFRRPYRLILMLAATVLSMGATGMSMLLIATPFLLFRETPRVGVMAPLAAIVALSALYMLDIPLPLVSRLDEIYSNTSSGAGRVMLPALQFLTLLADPSYLFTGDGAGSVAPSTGRVETLMTAWPMLKLTKEYGLLSMISFSIFYMSGIVGRFNIPLKAALSVVFFFTGGYLLNPVMVELLVILCFIVSPTEGQQFHARHLLRQRPA